MVSPEGRKHQSKAICSRVQVRKSQNNRRSRRHSVSLSEGFKRWRKAETEAAGPFSHRSGSNFISRPRIVCKTALKRAFVKRVDQLSKVEAEFDGFGAGGYEVGAAEGGEEVVEGFLVGQVDDGEAKAPLVAVPVEEVVVADGEVEEIAR